MKILKRLKDFFRLMKPNKTIVQEIIYDIENNPNTTWKINITECEDCGAMEFHPDWEACTDKEKEWYKSSPWSQGWVIQENQNELQTNTLS